MLKNGKDKPLNTQVGILKEILLKSDKLRIILECLSQSGLTNYYVAAGAVNQMAILLRTELKTWMLFTLIKI